MFLYPESFLSALFLVSVQVSSQEPHDSEHLCQSLPVGEGRLLGYAATLRMRGARTGHLQGSQDWKQTEKSVRVAVVNFPSQLYKLS